jgi:hypothetical protein
MTKKSPEQWAAKLEVESQIRAERVRRANGQSSEPLRPGEVPRLRSGPWSEGQRAEPPVGETP